MLKKLFKRHRKNSELSQDLIDANKNIELSTEKIPKHIAVIMDGNGRWAKSRSKPRTFGHKAGVEALREVVRYASDIGVSAFTVYAFSTENWKRPDMEVNFLMKLFAEAVNNEVKELFKNNVQLKFIGDLSKLPTSLREHFRKAMEYTVTNNGMVLSVAVNYGGRAEILHATKLIAEKVASGAIALADIDEGIFAQGLYTAGLPDVDLLIRPSGDLRISNFLLWQSAYTEFWCTEKYWPDFTPNDLKEAIFDFQKRERRFGGLNK